MRTRITGPVPRAVEGILNMEGEARFAVRYELMCLAVLLGEAFGIVYVIGGTVLDVLSLW